MKKLPERIYKINKSGFIVELYFVGYVKSHSTLGETYAIYAETSSHYPERVHIPTMKTSYFLERKMAIQHSISTFEYTVSLLKDQLKREQK